MNIYDNVVYPYNGSHDGAIELPSIVRSQCEEPKLKNWKFLVDKNFF
jgi:hypothetical protein